MPRVRRGLWARARAPCKGGRREREIPLIVCDYLYFASGGVFARDELPEGERDGACRVLVIKCAVTKCMFAHAVPQKGVDPDGFIVTTLKEDICWLGHPQVCIRRDNEPALARVVDQAVKILKDSEGVTASCEGSVPYDPQAQREERCGCSKGCFGLCC